MQKPDQIIKEPDGIILVWQHKNGMQTALWIGKKDAKAD